VRWKVKRLYLEELSSEAFITASCLHLMDIFSFVMQHGITGSFEKVIQGGEETFEIISRIFCQVQV